MPPPVSSPRFTFIAKVAGAIGLIALADALMFGWLPAPMPAAFALGWTIAITLTVAAIRRARSARIALAIAALFAVILVDDPSLLSWSLFWIAISTSALLPRRGFDDAARWALRLGIHALSGLITPFRDLIRVGRRARSGTWPRIRGVIAVLALPVIGGAAFLALFTGSNPIIAAAFDRITLPSLSGFAQHGCWWLFIMLATWSSFRPHAAVSVVGTVKTDHTATLPDIPVITLSLSLITFNAVFALQNGLDLIFLWSGAALPDNLTLADYAHRGAYTLIAAAILAGLFVLVALRPDSASARTPALRRWLVLWIVQTVLLVASSLLRLADYIAAYSMTVLRLSAMAWMFLVGVGLILICWRLLTARSAAWLLNANALAAMLVLSVASVVDLGATAAAWNVRHARTARDLDLCYLRNLGPSALLSLIALERRVQGARLQDRVAFVREEAMTTLIDQQANPQDWSWRGARRLAAAQVALGPLPHVVGPAPDGRECDGTPFPPPPPPPPPPPATPSARLTNGAEQ